ncbi:MAG: BlaI/MecI/CopY family transcriptional regulator [Holophagaceae bacterium]|nr:BlaI/MecI/CopY family transcriptional regulator [Holophagaceae bacterium]
MANSPPTPKPTEAEVGILQVLWELGPSSVKDVYGRVGRERALGYTAVLKLMQTMLDKGLLERDESERAHLYWPAQAKSKTQRALLGDFMAKVFAGSAGELVQMALQGRRLRPEEKAALRELLKGK